MLFGCLWGAHLILVCVFCLLCCLLFCVFVVCGLFASLIVLIASGVCTIFVVFFVDYCGRLLLCLFRLAFGVGWCCVVGDVLAVAV